MSLLITWAQARERKRLVLRVPRAALAKTLTSLFVGNMRSLVAQLVRGYRHGEVAQAHSAALEPQAPGVARGRPVPSRGEQCQRAAHGENAHSQASQSSGSKTCKAVHSVIWERRCQSPVCDWQSLKPSCVGTTFGNNFIGIGWRWAGSNGIPCGVGVSGATVKIEFSEHFISIVFAWFWL